DPLTVPDYRSALGASISGVRVAVIEEGFRQVGSEPDVDDAVEAAAEQLARLGAIVECRSIPWHRSAPAIWTPIALEGGLQVLVFGKGMGSNYQGLYVESMMRALVDVLERTNDLADTVKISLLAGLHASRTYHGLYYAKAQNLRRQLRSYY